MDQKDAWENSKNLTALEFRSKCSKLLLNLVLSRSLSSFHPPGARAEMEGANMRDHGSKASSTNLYKHGIFAVDL